MSVLLGKKMWLILNPPELHQHEVYEVATSEHCKELPRPLFIMVEILANISQRDLRSLLIGLRSIPLQRTDP